MSGPRADLGADLGGSWLSLCLADRRSAALRVARQPAPRRERLAAALTERLAAWGIAPPLGRLVVGSTGIWTPLERKELRRTLLGTARRVVVLPDLELAHAAAFAGGPGVLVLAGTGSAAWATDRRGGTQRAGGWGALLGDEGSGFWVGRRALADPVLRRGLPGTDPLALAHAPNPVRATAALCRRAFELAAGGDPGFLRLRRSAAAELARLAVAACRGLSLARPVPVSWHGGLFRAEPFLEDFLRALRRRGEFAPRPSLMRPEIAAALLPF